MATINRNMLRNYAATTNTTTEDFTTYLQGTANHNHFTTTLGTLEGGWANYLQEATNNTATRLYEDAMNHATTITATTPYTVWTTTTVPWNEGATTTGHWIPREGTVGVGDFTWNDFPATMAGEFKNYVIDPSDIDRIMLEEEILKDNSPRIAVVGSRQCGKSDLLIRKAMRYEGNVVVLSTLSNIGYLIEYIEKELDNMIDAKITNQDYARATIETRHSTIKICKPHISSLVGARANAVLIDNFESIQDDRGIKSIICGASHIYATGIKVNDSSIMGNKYITYHLS